MHTRDNKCAPNISTDVEQGHDDIISDVTVPIWYIYYVIWFEFCTLYSTVGMNALGNECEYRNRIIGQTNVFLSIKMEQKLKYRAYI